MPRRRMLVAVLVAVAFTARLAASRWGQQGPQQPTFRSGVTLVPVDVRVLDRKTGKPVTDVKQADFTVLEDDVKQEIGHFAPYQLSPNRMAGATVSKMAVRETAFDAMPATRRVFLFMLGRGRLQEPSRALDAVGTFIRTQLLPQDRIALFAYDRATPFTGNHEQIARLVDRLKTAHLAINLRVDIELESGMAGLYGSKSLPGSARALIDAAFDDAGITDARRLTGTLPAATAAENAADAGKTVARKQQAETVAASESLVNATKGSPRLGRYGGALSMNRMDRWESQAFTDLSLDDFVNSNAQTLQDLSSIYACIEYLRHFEGEKHLVFLTERGLSLTRREEEERLAKAASDARVALDTFQTGGLRPPKVAVWDQAFAFQILRSVAEETGGVSAIAESGKIAMDRINVSTMTGYQIGYYPSNGNWTGAYRKISVKVNRPDTTVLYRHGYYAQGDIPSFDRRGFITAQRIQAALNFRREIGDIKLKLNTSVAKTEGGGYALEVQLRIDPTNLAFTLLENGVHVGRVDIAILALDQNGNTLASHYRNVDLTILDDVFQKMRKDGIPYNATIPVSPSARHVRAVVYDYKADLIGRVDTTVW